MTFSTGVDTLPGFLESSRYMASTPDPGSYGFNFNTFSSGDANPLAFNGECSTDRTNFEKDNNQLRIPTFEETLKPVISAT